MIDNSVFVNKRVSFYTLGCKLNFSETSTIGRTFLENGFRKVAFGDPTDVCVINTCSVTDLADRKCRQAIKKVIKANPNAYVMVTGCYAQLKPEEIAQIPGVDVVLGANEKFRVMEFIGNLTKKEHGEVHTIDIKKVSAYSPSFSAGDRTRCFLKVQDGCDYFCSYCTIPIARGRSRNGTISDTVKQAEEAVALGAREIVLTGVNIGDFGKSTGDSFFDLVKALDQVEGVDRFRISSIEPNLLTDEIIDYVSQSPHFTPHFHIPLQAGSNEVLKLMRRRYDRELFAHRVQSIKEHMPHAFIGVDVIVGTRGETREMFMDGFEFLKDLDVSQLHVFTYSERPNTKALTIDGSVDPSEKKERSQMLHILSDKKVHAFYQKQMGTCHNVLFEAQTDGVVMHGFTENYIRVEVPYNEKWVNQVLKVELGSFVAKGDALEGKILEA